MYIISYNINCDTHHTFIVVTLQFNNNFTYNLYFNKNNKYRLVLTKNDLLYYFQAYQYSIHYLLDNGVIMKYNKRIHQYQLTINALLKSL